MNQTSEEIPAAEAPHVPPEIPLDPAPEFDAAAFRRELLSLASDNDAAPFDADHRRLSIDLALCCASLFGEDLARETLWDRIASGLVKASAIARDGDTDLLVEELLRHIHASEGRAAAHVDLPIVLEDLAHRDAAWRRALSLYLRQRQIIVIARARMAWEKKKVQWEAERAMAKGGELPNGEIVEQQDPEESTEDPDHV